MAGGYNLIGDPVLTATPAVVACADTAVDATSTKTVVIKGEDLIAGVELAVQGAGFTLDTFSITEADVESAAGKTITVTFSPTEAKAYAGKIILSGGGASLVINITGTGTGA